MVNIGIEVPQEAFFAPDDINKFNIMMIYYD